VVRLAAIGRAEIGGAKLEEMLLVDVTSDVVVQWREHRLKVDQVKGSTINRDLNLLSHVFSTARDEWKWIAISPTTKVRRPKSPPSRERLPTDDQIERICFALGVDIDTQEPVTTKSGVVAIAFLLAIESAMRAGEMCKLLPDWVKGNVVHLPASATKNGKKRDVPLSSRAVELLALLPKPKQGGTVMGIESESLDALFRKARKRALVDGLTFLDSRHLAITRLAKKLDILPLARMVGHTDLKMLQVYYNESAADIATRLD
jgi:integrase